MHNMHKLNLCQQDQTQQAKRTFYAMFFLCVLVWQILSPFAGNLFSLHAKDSARVLCCFIRQIHLKTTAFPDHALHLDMAAVFLDDFLDDIES